MSNNLILNRLFTLASFKRLTVDCESSVYYEVVERYTDKSTKRTNAEAISEIYSFMREKYRNQYYYKNTILNKLLLGVHSINTTTALTEVPISNSKADFVLINGKAVVYEIKTELDNLDRLEGQIHNYYKAFDHVCVLTCEEYATLLLDRFEDTKVGIYVLTSRDTIKRIKQPEKSDDVLEHDVMFGVLNKPEYEEILVHYYDELPNTSQVKYYRECKEWFSRIPIHEAYCHFIRVLKKRNAVKRQDLFYSVPYEIKSLVYFSHYNDEDYRNLSRFLSKEIGG